MAATDVDVAAERVWTVVVGGGTGHRFGGPKQYEQLGDRRVLDHAVAAADAVSAGVVVVLPPTDAARESAVAGGATRSESVRRGLAAVPASATIVCVHDAARPFAPPDLFRAVISAVASGADGAVPGVPVTDTIKIVGPVEPDAPTDASRPGAASIVRRVVDTPRRDDLVAVQTPQAFRAEVLRAAHASGEEATDDAGLVERAGGRVVVVPGDPDNTKITHPDDLERARLRLAGAAPS